MTKKKEKVNPYFTVFVGLATITNLILGVVTCGNSVEISNLQDLYSRIDKTNENLEVNIDSLTSNIQQLKILSSKSDIQISELIKTNSSLVKQQKTLNNSQILDKEYSKPILTLENTSITPINNSRRFILSFNLKNCGNRPAKNVKSSGYLLISTNKEEEISAHSVIAPFEFQHSIMPNQTRGKGYYFILLENQTIESLSNSLCFKLLLTYRDDITNQNIEHVEYINLIKLSDNQVIQEEANMELVGLIEQYISNIEK